MLANTGLRSLGFICYAIKSHCWVMDGGVATEIFIRQQPSQWTRKENGASKKKIRGKHYWLSSVRVTALWFERGIDTLRNYKLGLAKDMYDRVK